MKNTNHKYDFTSNTLTVTKTFLKKAGQYNSPEYKILLGFQKDHPEMKINSVKTLEKKTNHETEFLTMETIIRMCEDSAKRLEEFVTIRRIAKTTNHEYAYVKKWFDNNYANASKPDFDNEGHYLPKTAKEMEDELKAKEEEKLQDKVKKIQDEFRKKQNVA